MSLNVRGVVALTCSFGVAGVLAQPVVDPFYASDYSIVNLGAPQDVPAAHGGLCFLRGNPNTLLIGGAANAPAGAIYTVDVVRDADGNITGFAGPATYFAACPNIDGGVDYHESGVLFATGYPFNYIHQFLPGAVAPTRTDVAADVASSVGTLRFVPSGFPGAGRFKVVSYNAARWYDVELVPDGSGTFSLGTVSPAVQLSGGPEGVVYVGPSNPLFDVNSILLCEYGTGTVVSYEVDPNGDPIPSTRRPFITGLSGAEGAAIDPVTGQFLFSTFGGVGNVLVVRGFVPPPPPMCDADVNCDGSPDQGDVACMILAVAGDTACMCQDPDFNLDGSADQGDVAAIIGVVAGQPCP